MIYLRLFYEFAKVGLFTIGGGMVTIPFLQDMSARTGWFTLTELTNFISISESTPGALAVNLATYTGYTTAGTLGGIVSTLGLIFPALFLTTLVGIFLEKFRNNRTVDRAFYGLRPCVLALILYSFSTIARNTFIRGAVTLQPFSLDLDIKAVMIFLAVLIVTNIKQMQKLHPVFFLFASGIAGILLFR